MREWLVEGDHLETVVDWVFMAAWFGVGVMTGKWLMLRRVTRSAAANPKLLYDWAEQIREAELRAAEGDR
jgi:hypothetical protein